MSDATCAASASISFPSSDRRTEKYCSDVSASRAASVSGFTGGSSPAFSDASSPDGFTGGSAMEFSSGKSGISAPETSPGFSPRIAGISMPGFLPPGSSGVSPASMICSVFAASRSAVYRFSKLIAIRKITITSVTAIIAALINFLLRLLTK